MSRNDKILGWFLLLAFLAISTAVVFAAECPPGIPKCKVLVLTPDMEQALTGQNMILDNAEWANRVGLSNAVAFFRKAIAEAPAGEPGKPVPDGKPEPRK